MRVVGIIRSKRFLLTCAMLLLLALITVWWCDHRVTSSAKAFVFDSEATMPYNRVGLVLGTSEKGRRGGPNPFFVNRIEAAAALYRTGKVEQLLLSGDNGREGYNEPEDMRRALIAAGVDSTHITLDFAGFRTFDSVVRAREVFGQQRFTIVSQRFHNERAIYIAQRLGIDAVGFNAPDVGRRQGLRTQLREKIARVKVFLDLAFGVQPHFLGEPVTVGEQVLH
ncbi:MAG: ElyC/SanA/YdcF family protein [Flavobacteriales bacterium]